jgi:hypothetical protein
MRDPITHQTRRCEKNKDVSVAAAVISTVQLAVNISRSRPFFSDGVGLGPGFVCTTARQREWKPIFP